MSSSGKRYCSGLEKCEKEAELGRHVYRAQRLAVMKAVKGLQAESVYDQQEIKLSWQTGYLESKGYGVSPENIILYGQSIGTVPTVDLASRYECAAVILHSPLMSGLRVAFPDTRKTYCFDAFPSIDKISKVTSPVLVIHGTEDEVIDFSHGLAMYERCPRAVEPLWVEGAGHNDIELYAQYLERLKQFISHELPNS
ncbi:Alpha/beta hydrolase domain-containing protein 17C [Microtus ochrogaster]|uniref:Alpha/beta hydrolase domain-containing protein 17C n=1 Tax=Microtus ochrogaster TaxID=79684 RepID=A0A8J6GL06_MICOH|nr:Alpha/beta hydrolase domain-containing protein 17C [Microtus ochrogaster]